MANANPQGVGRVVKILREPGRTHGFAAAGQLRRVEPLRLAAPATNPLTLSGQPFSRPELAPQAVEKPQNAPGNGAPGSRSRETSLPQAQASACAATQSSRPQMAPQATEKPQFAPGNGALLFASAGDEPARSRVLFAELPAMIGIESKNRVSLAKVAENGAQALVIVARTADSTRRPAPCRPGRGRPENGARAAVAAAPNWDGGPFPPVTRSQP